MTDQSKTLIRAGIAFLVVLASLSCGSSQQSVSGDREVAWREWNEAAFARAQEEQKLVVLYLTAPWCRQCAEQEADVFRRADIRETIDTASIAIRVNAEQYPNIYDRYTLGGLPSCLFLTPEGYPFGGCTNVPADSFKVLLDRVVDAWQHTPAVVQIQAAKLDSLFRASQTTLRLRRPNEQMLIEAEEAIYTRYDSTYGGLGDQPKFPLPEINRFMYNATGPSGEPLFRAELTGTFTEQSKLIDTVWGGLCRMAMFADWSGIGFEKLVDQNAGVAQNYVDMYQITHDEGYRRNAEQILAWIDRAMRTELGWGWYSSQAGYLRLNGKVYDLGSFLAMGDSERRKYGVPEIDRSLYTGENAAAISAYLQAGRVFERPELIEYAIRSLDSLGQRAVGKGGLFYHAPLTEDKGVLGLAEDQIAMMTALLDAYETMGDRKYLKGAELTARVAFSSLYDPAVGGLNLEPLDKDAIGRMKTPLRSYDLICRAVVSFTRLFYLTANEEYRRPTERIAAYALSIELREDDLRRVLLGNAYLWLTRYPVKLAIVGPRGAEYDSLMSAIWRRHQPRLVVSHLGDGASEVSYGQLKIPPTSRAGIYACGEDTISTAITAPDSLETRLTEFLLAMQRLRKVEKP